MSNDIATAYKLIDEILLQGGDGYGVYSNSSKSSEISFPHVPVQGYDAPPMLLSQSNPVSFYGFGRCLTSVPPPPPPYMHYPPSSCGPQAMCDSLVPFPLQPSPPCYNEFCSFPTATMNNQMASLALAESPPGGIIFTEQRGIHIREISRRTSEEEIRRMVVETTGPEAGLINLIEAPLDKNRNSCGWASVHFHSADLARRMVDRLNGAEFKGKALQVRLMKEGEAIYYGPAATTRTSSAKHHHRGSKHHRREDSKKTERKERDRGEKASSSTPGGSAPSTSSKSMAPLVVGGSGTSLTAKLATASSSVSSLSKAKEKQGGKKTSTSTVIIADGSSSGRSKTEKASKR